MPVDPGQFNIADARRADPGDRAAADIPGARPDAAEIGRAAVRDVNPLVEEVSELLAQVRARQAQIAGPMRHGDPRHDGEKGVNDGKIGEVERELAALEKELTSLSRRIPEADNPESIPMREHITALEKRVAGLP